jgi:hypothetical protein
MFLDKKILTDTPGKDDTAKNNKDESQSSVKLDSHEVKEGNSQTKTGNGGTYKGQKRSDIGKANLAVMDNMAAWF